MKRRCLPLVIAIVLVASVGADAGPRPDKDWKNFFGHISGGILLPQGDLDDIVDEDFYLSGGFLYWPTDWALGLNVDLAYSDTDIKSSVIQAINDELAGMGAGSVAGGDVQVWSLSANGVWGPDTDGNVGFYLTAGVGLDYIEGRITDNGLVYYPPVCDPWFWWCIPGGVGPGTIVVSSRDTTEFSWNVGAGVTFETGSGSQVFIEARLKTAETDPRSSEYLPLVVGFRW